MPEITSHGAFNRHITEYLTTDKRVKQYKCKTLQNPDYFYNGSVFAPVDVGFQKAAVSTAGNILLRDKSIVSVGYKQTDDAYKLFGLRPDEKQDGSEQFEISIQSIEINGKPQTINLRDRLAVSPITTKFGNNLYIQNARQRTRVMVEATNAVSGFKIALRLHLKGLIVTYRPDLDEYWIYNEQGQFRFRLGKPYLVDPSDMNPIQGELGNPYPPLVKHSLTEISKGEYLYVKEPTEAFGKAILPEKFLIDADTVYSSTTDGSVYAGSTTWSTAHDATTGDGVLEATAVNYDNAISIFISGSTIYIIRAFFEYNTSGVAGTITAASNFLYGYAVCSGSVCVMKGTQGSPLAVADYDAFSGADYFNMSSYTTETANEFVFNATGRSEINQAGTTKICSRQYANDYSNSNPHPTQKLNGCYFAENTGTTKDPYLFITTAAAANIPAAMHHLKMMRN